MGEYRAVRAYIYIEADQPLTFYTGKLVKTLLYSLFKEITLLHNIRGVISPLHISPIFKPGSRDWELGDVVTPRYVNTSEEGERLEPVEVNGEYIIHVGGPEALVRTAMSILNELTSPLQVKMGDTIIRFKLSKLEDVTLLLLEKQPQGDRVTLYLKAPTKLFNVYTKSNLPKFNISPVEVLMAPYMLYTRQYTLDENVLLNASRLLGNLTETYYSITTVKPLLVPFNDRKTPTMTGKITYIIKSRTPQEHQEITRILQTAEITGIGQSRQNGFGTITWK